MSNMISVASGFQYSVNIGYDLNNDDKLKSFIPTQSALALLEDILLSTQVTSTERAPVFFGGTGFEPANQNMPASLPERYEMGTMNISGMAGLNAALKWKLALGVEAFWQKEQEHRRKLISLLQEYWFIKVVGNYPDCNYVGIVSCLVEGISTDSAGEIFNRCGVAVRTGLQCAPFAHQFAGTHPAGTVRFSVGYFTSGEDFEKLKEALDYIEENL